MKPKLICVLGETGSGKDTIVNEAINQSLFDIKKVCSYADRPMRAGETNGVEHYFISTEEFDKLKETHKDDILAYTRIKNPNQIGYDGYQYMALSDELENSHIYIIDYNGLKFLKEKYSDKIDIVTVYIYASFFTRLKRAKAKRSDFKTEFKKRVKAEKEQFKEFKKLKLYDYKIRNVDGFLDSAVLKMRYILSHELVYQNIKNMPHLKHQKTNS